MRTLLRPKPVMIFDEPVGYLNHALGKRLLDKIYELRNSRIVLISTHRLTNVEQADRIIVLGSGSVIESGTHAELLRNEGTYFQMWQHQKYKNLDD